MVVVETVEVPLPDPVAMNGRINERARLGTAGGVVQAGGGTYFRLRATPA
jgi:hypothetical protein